MDDWLLSTIAQVEEAVAEVSHLLDEGIAVIDAARTDREAGVPLPVLAAALLERGARPRRAIQAAFLRYEQAVSLLRARVVRALIEDEGLSRTQIATAMHVSRQTVSRLYEAGSRTAQRVERP